MLKDGHLAIETKDTLIKYDAPLSIVDSFSSGDVPRQYYCEPIHQAGTKMFWMQQLKENITYITVITFSESFDEQEFHSTINQFSYSKGIILDLRSNAGGMTIGIIDLAACFFQGTRTMWYQRGKVGAGHNDFSDYYSITATS
jgi:hypothetical protein